ncbi:MAG: hypothetical protein JO040_12685 [Gemmatimonadetes bacterium]|nr:hypothetical protein [Gemmatimonadota bacterium]
MNDEVIQGLTDVLTGLLPASADLSLRPVLMVNPVRITPTGLGGLVAPSADPAGEVVGRRLQARVSVTVKAADEDGLGPAVTGVTQAFLGVDRATLIRQGVLRLTLGELGADSVAANGRARREVGFDVLYEFLKGPSEAGGIIQTIPLQLNVGDPGAAPAPGPAPAPAPSPGPAPGPGLAPVVTPPAPPAPPPPLLQGDFTAQSLAGFEVVDDPLTTKSKPSQWSWAAAAHRIEQRSAIMGGDSKVPALRPGTYLVLKTTPSLPAVADFTLTARMEAGAAGGIGLVFRWQDPNNFYFFLMDSLRNSRILARKVAGVFAPLSTPALVTTASFSVGAVHQVRLQVQGDTFVVRIDGGEALTGRDASLPGAGRVGLMSRSCDQAFFYGVDLVRP